MTWVKVKERAVTAAEVISVSKTEKKSLSLAKNFSPVRQEEEEDEEEEDEDEEDEMEMEDEEDDEEEEEDEDEEEVDKEHDDDNEEEVEDEEVAKVVNIVSTCVTAIWVTVIAFRATRWVVEASVTSVVVEDPDIIWMVAASVPVWILNSS